MQQLIDLYLKDERFNISVLLEGSLDDLDGEDSMDIDVFRRLVEAAMYLGIWNGFVGLA